MDRILMKAELKRDEGVRAKPYVDTVGKTTIGVGRNLTDKGISAAEIDLLLEADIDQAARDVHAIYPEWDLLSEQRQRVLVNMAFNLGRARLAQFMGMLSALRAMDYEKAAIEMRSSKWYTQVGDRGKRLALMMEEG